MSESEAAPGPQDSAVVAELGPEPEPQDSAVVPVPEPRDSAEAAGPEPRDSAVVAVPEPRDGAEEPEPEDSSPVSPTAEADSSAAQPQVSQPGPQSDVSQSAPQPEVGHPAAEPPAGWALPDAAPQFAKFGAPPSPSPGQQVTAPFPPPGQQVTAPFPLPGQLATAPFLVPAPAPAPARKYPRKRIALISVGVVTALALVAAGIIALWPGRSGNSIVAVAHCQPADLASCLIKAPDGAVQLTDAAQWDQATTVTSDLYSSNITADAAGVSTDTKTLLDSDGLQKVVHRDWNAVDGNNVDLVLLQFSSQKGAESWHATRAGEILAAYRGPAVSIPGDSSGKAFVAAKPDAKGNVSAAYSAVVGDIVLNVAYSSPKTLDAKDLQNWAGTELASLHAAPPAAADPADAAPGTQRVACTGQLTSCLMPLPSGAEHWTSPNSSDWVSGSTLSQHQFIKLFWQTDSQSQVQSNFTTNGVTAIAHQDWLTDGGDKQADIYLIQTITAAGASQLNGDNFGEPDWGKGEHGTSHTIPGEPQAQAWYTNQDSDGFSHFYFEENIGNVIVHGWMFFSGSFDSATADRWAQTQLNRVSNSASTQPMGLYPLTAPALPASSQGSCPASGDCLLPVPAGATDTTASSYQVGHDLEAAVYAAQYEPDNGTDVGTWLSSDGYVSGEHRAWSTPDGANADVALLKFGSPTQAQAAVQLEYGLNATAQHDRVCTDSKLPDSLCLAAAVTVSDPLQKETIRVLAWKGDYEVSVSVTKSNAADVADAYLWAQRQLDLLPAS